MPIGKVEAVERGTGRGRQLPAGAALNVTGEGRDGRGKPTVPGSGGEMPGPAAADIPDDVTGSAAGWMGPPAVSGDKLCGLSAPGMDEVIM